MFGLWQRAPNCISQRAHVYGFTRLLNDTIRYDSVDLTCSKKLTGSQISLPHGINKKLKCETKNKLMNVVGKSDPVPLS